MIDEILNIIAPHHCMICGKLGSIWCTCCKNDMIKPINLTNSASLDSTVLKSGDYTRLIILSTRDEKMKELIDVYKFRPCPALAKEFSSIIIDNLPKDEHYTLVPLPSSQKHIKQRGFDHIALITKQIALNQKYDYCPVLKRYRHATQQLGKSRAERIENAKNMFYVDKQLDKNKHYLLLDDVLTTGATLKYACTTLREAGAEDISLVIIARQNLK